MIERTSNTWWANIYLSGPIEIARQIIRQNVFEAGLCVTITPTSFIYTGGEEIGYVVGLINYPRFPMSGSQIDSRAEELARLLLDGTFQHSALIMNQTTTYWISKRENS